MTDAKVTEKTHLATLRLLEPLILSSSLKFSDRMMVIKNVEQALANAERDGRKEGLEEAAKLLDKSRVGLLKLAQNPQATSVHETCRQGARDLEGYIKAIRALQEAKDKP